MSSFFDGPMSTTEAAEYLRVAPGTLANMRCAGRGPRYYGARGVGILYYREDLDDYVKRFRHDTAESMPVTPVIEPPGCPPAIKRRRRPRTPRKSTLEA